MNNCMDGIKKFSVPTMRIVLKVLEIEPDPKNWPARVGKSFCKTIEEGSLIMIEFPLLFFRTRRSGLSSFDIKLTNLDTKDTYISTAGMIDKLWSVILDYEEIYI